MGVWRVFARSAVALGVAAALGGCGGGGDDDDDVTAPDASAPLDECAAGLDRCDDDATCTDTPDGYTCECVAGYTGDGVTCIDVDECTEGTDDCGDNAVCNNLAGSFACACATGYAGDGYTCVDVDECSAGTHDCDANATCANTVGGFDCACNPGYAGGGTICTDVDECSLGADDCDANASCTNTPGSFTCACDAGWTGDGTTCSDIDECGDGSAGCDSHATCANTPGSFTCTCDPGWTGSGTACSDVDECALGTDDCDPTGATCTNEAGSYSCACNPGFSGDGVDCTFDCPQPPPTGSLPLVYSVPVKCSAADLYTDYITGDVAVAEDLVVVGMPNWLSSSSTDHPSALAFRFDGTEFVFEDELLPAVGDGGGNYGDHVEISRSGDTVVVSNRAEAYVFRRAGGAWTGGEALLPVFDAGASTFLALVATTDTHTALVYYGGGSGTAGIYVFDPATRTETARIFDARLNVSSNGNSISIDGDLLVAANRSTGSSPATIIYRFDGTDWNEEQSFTFGHEVATDGTRIAVFDYGTTTVRVLEQSGTWFEASTIACNYECDLSVFGDYLITSGAPYHGGIDIGALFLWVVDTWTTAYTPAYEAAAVDVAGSFAVQEERGFADDPIQVIQFAAYP